ncbi:MAG TPA: META domain-containing protein, partial [Propionibacteriaceae bacterium]|nr:META domain-containing protein [Propionibacteriaceae bacterium]
MTRFGFTSTALRALGTATVLLLTACASTSPSAVPSPPAELTSLSGTAWVLDILGGKPAVEATTATARFAADGTISGSSGCNRYSGPFSTSGNAIKVGDLASTMMACGDDDIMAQEKSFLDALSTASTFSVDEATLTLADRDGTALATLTWQDQDLAGSSWTVTGYNNGKGAVVSVLDDSTATVAFTEAGKVNGTGGCNRFMGGFQAEGSAL